MPSEKDPGRTYPAALRLLVGRALGGPGPVPREAPPGGPLTARIEPQSSLGRSPVTCRAVTGEVPGAEEIDDLDYWSRALAHRLLCVGVFIDLAGVEMNDSVRQALEGEILVCHRERYGSTPLSHDLLDLLRLHHRRRPEDDAPTRLDSVRADLITTPTLGELLRRRARHRAETVQSCIEGNLSQTGLSLVELFTDVFALCVADRIDLDAAQRIAQDHGGSIARAMNALSDDGTTTVERLLPHLLRSGISLDDFAPASRDAARRLARRRGTVAWETFLDAPAEDLPSSEVDETGRTTDSLPPPSVRPDGTDASQNQGRATVEDPLVTYRRILAGLEERILGRPQLCRRLALSGLAHLLGVQTQRLLLCGGTGCGKTHAAIALAEVLDQPVMRIDMSDVTATGWKGLDIPDVLDGLASRARDSVDGSVLVLDELDKVRIQPRSDGNSLQSQVQLQGSLLALIAGGVVTAEGGGGHQLDTARLLVIGTGAFGGRFTSRPPTTDELVEWGWIPELAARWGERHVLPPPSRKDALELLRNSERSVTRRLAPLTSALGIEIEAPPEVLAYVVDRWFRTGADFRTAAEWLLDAARSRISGALDSGELADVVLTPDDVEALGGKRDRERDG